MKTAEAIQTCIEAAQEARAKRECYFTAWEQNMPWLTTRPNIRNFIACVAAGVAEGCILHDSAQLYLNSAQMALSACPRTRVRKGLKGGAA